MWRAARKSGVPTALQCLHATRRVRALTCFLLALQLSTSTGTRRTRRRLPSSRRRTRWRIWSRCRLQASTASALAPQLCCRPAAGWPSPLQLVLPWTPLTPCFPTRPGWRSAWFGRLGTTLHAAVTTGTATSTTRPWLPTAPQLLAIVLSFLILTSTVRARGSDIAASLLAHRADTRAISVPPPQTATARKVSSMAEATCYVSRCT